MQPIRRLMPVDPLSDLGDPAVLIDQIRAVVARADLAVADALVRKLVRTTVEAIRGLDLERLQALGSAIQSFTAVGIKEAEEVAPRLAARIEHLLPIVTEAMDLEAPSSDDLLRASLGRGQQVVLRELLRAGGELPRAELATRPDVDDRNLSRVCAGLEAVALVERLRVPGVKAVTVRLTPKGRRMAGALAPARIQRSLENAPEVDTALFAAAL